MAEVSLLPHPQDLNPSPFLRDLLLWGYRPFFLFHLSLSYLLSITLSHLKNNIKYASNPSPSPPPSYVSQLHHKQHPLNNSQVGLKAVLQSAVMCVTRQLVAALVNYFHLSKSQQIHRPPCRTVTTPPFMLFHLPYAVPLCSVRTSMHPPGMSSALFVCISPSPPSWGSQLRCLFLLKALLMPTARFGQGLLHSRSP